MKVIGIMKLPYAPINLALPWHGSAIEVADCNHNYGQALEIIKKS